MSASHSYAESATSTATYIRPALEDNRLFARTLAVGECADRLRRLVLEAREQLVELLHAQGLEEPFPGFDVSVSKLGLSDKAAGVSTGLQGSKGIDGEIFRRTRKARVARQRR